MARTAPTYEPEPGGAGPTPEELCADGVLSVKAAARFMSCSRLTVERMLKARLLVPLRIGSRVMIPKRSLQLLLARMLRESMEGGA